MLSKRWIHFLVRTEAIDITKLKTGRREDLLLRASGKENIRDLSQRSASLSSKIGEVLSKGMWVLMKGLEQRRIWHKTGAKGYTVPASVAGNLSGQHHPSILHLTGTLVPAQLKDLHQTVVCIPWGGARTVFLLDCGWLLFLCSFILLLPFPSLQFSSVQSLSRVQLFATPWIAARQASLSITNSRSPPKPLCIESMMPSSHLILCRPLLLLPQSLPASGSFPMSQLFASGGQEHLNTETCSRTSIVARLRSQKWLRPKWLFLCQESHSWFSFSGDLQPYVLMMMVLGICHNSFKTIWRNRHIYKLGIWKWMCT